MDKKLKVVIADEKTQLGATCKNVLDEYGMETSLCEKDGLKLLEKIKNYKPDVILADVFMPNLDILGVLDNLKNSDLKGKPLVMAMSSYDNGNDQALVINTKGWRTRGISEPNDERVLQGPREGFDEALMLNLAICHGNLNSIVWKKCR